jgi:two-component system CheB/CheR fusion protein
MANKRPKSKSSNDQKKGSVPPSPQPADFLIAGVGASAGGVEAFTELLTNLPSDTGMAFVLIQHLDPKHESLLSALLGKKSTMPVVQVTKGMHLEPNRVYVIPPNATMTVSDHSLQLEKRIEAGGTPMPVDLFMRSLAAQQGNRAIGIILSGLGSDGTLGMAEIQARGGVTFAQDEGSAKYDSMPRSAIDAGCADYVLPPRSIAHELVRIARHPYTANVHTEDTEVPVQQGNGLATIFQLLSRSTGLDFTHYRQTTILRRIQRRMVVHKIDSLEQYARFLQVNPSEIKVLYQDLLISVTSFFRNPVAFEALRTEVFPDILKGSPSDRTTRIWTPACSSGEETYSVAITLLEYLGDRAGANSIQFFGTDVSESNVRRARSGVYPANIQADVSPQRLRRFFGKVEGGYRISKSIRDMCIFAQHNVLSDPPFSRMDLICCRNLLIYLEPVLQAKVISLFHYAMRPGGFLALGTSEGIGSASNLFATVNRIQKIFSRKTTTGRQAVTFSLEHSPGPTGTPAIRTSLKPTDSAWNFLEAQKEFDRRVLSQYSPATVFVNEDLEIIYTRGNLNQFLKLMPGKASLSILRMAQEGLLLELRNAIVIARAKEDNVVVRRENVQIRDEDSGENGRSSSERQSAARAVGFEVTPINVPSLKERYYMIVFHEKTSEKHSLGVAQKSRRGADSKASAAQIAKLQQELAAAKEYLQSVIETQEATNEELQSANEEILSSNEELQSTNEELETAKEELQSANEELTTVNDELRGQNLEIAQANTDLTNLFGSIEIAVVMIGSDLTVRRFTPEAQKFLGLISTDVGRPLLNIHPSVEIPDFEALVKEVMSTMKPINKQLSGDNNKRYLVRILPCRTLENKIDGAVITIIPVAARNAADANQKTSMLAGQETNAQATE